MMRLGRVVVLILGVSPTLLSASESPFSAARLSRAVAGQAKRSARAEPTTWDRLERLPRGLPVRVATDDEGSLTLYFVRATEEGIVAFDASGLPDRSVRLCLEVMREWPVVFDESSPAEFRRGDRRASARGIWIGDERIVDLARRVKRVSRWSIAEVSLAAPNRRREQKIAGAVLMAIGLGVNAVAGYRTCRCGEGAMSPVGSALFWTGVVVAATAPKLPDPDANGRTVIYRRPRPLDGP